MVQRQVMVSCCEDGGRFAHLSVFCFSSLKQMVVMQMDTIKVRQNVYGPHSPKSNYKSYKLIFK